MLHFCVFVFCFTSHSSALHVHMRPPGGYCVRFHVQIVDSFSTENSKNQWDGHFPSRVQKFNILVIIYWFSYDLDNQKNGVSE